METPELDPIVKYNNTDSLIEICKSFEGQSVKITATFMEKTIVIDNCNAVGDILEDIFFECIKEKLIDFEEGPKQASPDYYGMNKQYEFEQKVFMTSPGFDIGNFTSYVNQLCNENGVYKKLFNTQYLVFEYILENNEIKIVKFHYLPVYKLVSYSGKYPLSMQVKKNVWYNIRPDSVKKWYSDDKTPQLFIENIIKCIKQCPHIEDKDNKIKLINDQFTIIKSKYAI
jgi:hypothetical protein